MAPSEGQELVVQVDELRNFAALLLDHLEEHSGASIELDHDYYCNIPSDERYQVYEKPENLDIGQLADDLERLRALATDSDLVIGHALMWLGELLRAIGTENPR